MQPDLTDLMTQFLALDQCLPRLQYLSIVHIPTLDEKQVSGDSKLEYDLEWLAVLRKTHHLSAATCENAVDVDLPPDIKHTVTDEEIEWVRDRLRPGGGVTIPLNFEVTVPPHVEPAPGEPLFLPPPLPRMGNPQTDRLLELLQLEHLPNLTMPYDPAQGQARG